MIDVVDQILMVSMHDYALILLYAGMLRIFPLDS